jgi:DNA-binding IclR family transcriptional regulator
MTSLLTDAVRLLRPLVDETGDVRRISVPDCARLLGLTEQQAVRVIEDLQEAGFLVLVRGRIQPTVAGIALGMEVATSVRQIHEREQSARSPFWTYVPEEVNLER